MGLRKQPIFRGLSGLQKIFTPPRIPLIERTLQRDEFPCGPSFSGLTLFGSGCYSRKVPFGRGYM